ncbi:hypothetical protein PpBr36_03158 [Pyricularia pennisetigena]|uniref:hypothetical protein n=1 Tax=Pyricularia pennisetigena TaxID=1578925 RepID=UPI00114DD191|nr:hypothetical protein PpBr36_03158 [Pyricularia pennisetigena]TLS29893.1 hypothetical protein PpBr36_03158 [Pyricularia pennisetigena]
MQFVVRLSANWETWNNGGWGGERPDHQGSGGQIQQQLGSAQSRGRRRPSLARAQRVGTLAEWDGKSSILL